MADSLSPYSTWRSTAGRPLERPPSEGRTRGNEGACDVTELFLYVLTLQSEVGNRLTVPMWWKPGDKTPLPRFPS
jgi:hypothetical protein